MTGMNTAGYERLAEVLQRAYEQASGGKGHERHANGLPFHEQPMQTINKEQGSIDGFLFQARKKAIEARGLPAGRAQAELLGAINYLAGAVIALDSWATGTLPKVDNRPTNKEHPEPEALAGNDLSESTNKPWYPDDRNWVEVSGGLPPLPAYQMVSVLHECVRIRRQNGCYAEGPARMFQRDPSIVAYTTETAYAR